MKTIITTLLILSYMWLHAQDAKNLDIITPDTKKTTLTFEKIGAFGAHSLDSCAYTTTRESTVQP